MIFHFSYLIFIFFIVYILARCVFWSALILHGGAVQVRYCVFWRKIAPKSWYLCRYCVFCLVVFFFCSTISIIRRKSASVGRGKAYWSVRFVCVGLNFVPMIFFLFHTCVEQDLFQKYIFSSVALISILCRSLEHVAKFLRRNFARSSLYR